MDNFDIPIFKKSYDLYKLFHAYRSLIPKQDRYTVWQKSENVALEIIEIILEAGQIYEKSAKLPVLEKASIKLNLLRVFIRLLKETKTLDNRKYALLQSEADEIGRMLGGWIKSAKEKT